MKSLSQKSSPQSSPQLFGAAMRVVTLSLFLAVFGASAALAQTRAYTTSFGSNTVSVIDPALDAVVNTIPVGAGPNGIAVTPNGAFVYVANFSSGNVSVISAATELVVATVTVGNGPGGIAITPNGAFAYVANSSDGTVSVINTATYAVVATVGVGGSPRGIAITPDGAFAYVSGNTVAVINTATYAVVATVPLGDNTSPIAITPDGAFAYVGGGFSVSRIFVISTATQALVDTITPFGNSFLGLDITPDGSSVYVSSLTDGNVLEIDTATHAVTFGDNVGLGAGGVAVDPNGTFVYVTNGSTNSVSKISTATNLIVATITVASPNAIAFGVRAITGPTNKDQCKHGGWATFTNPTFSNQGQCVSYVNHLN